MINVSLVITSFNHRPYLERLLPKLGELARAGHQIIVTDDASTDGSVELLRANADADMTFRLSTVREGVSAATNAGLALATNDYVALLASDDDLLPGGFDIALAELKRTNADLVFCRPELINDDGVSLRSDIFPAFNRTDSDAFNEDPLSYLISRGNVICASTTFGYRDVFKQTGMFNESLLQLQDYEYWIRAAVTGFNLLISSSCWAQYRVHENNLSRSSNNKRMQLERRSIARSLYRNKGAINIIRKKLASYFPIVNTQDIDSRVLLAWLLLQHVDPILRSEGVMLAYECLADNSHCFELFGLSKLQIWEIANADA